MISSLYIIHWPYVLSTRRLNSRCFRNMQLGLTSDFLSVVSIFIKEMIHSGPCAPISSGVHAGDSL
jgi:hypothetical protein